MLAWDIPTRLGTFAHQRREPLEITELYDRFAPCVIRWAARLGGPAIDAEDVMQEVFLIAHRKLDRPIPEEAIQSWLYGITLNRVRKRWRRPRERSLTEECLQLPSEAPDPAESVAARQAQALFYRALAGINARYRSYLVMFELEGLSGEEIAGLHGVKVSTVWVILHRARAQFASRVRALEPAWEGVR